VLSLDPKGTSCLGSLANTPVCVEKSFCPLITCLVKPGCQMLHSVKYLLEEHADLFRQHVSRGCRHQELLCLLSIQPTGLIRCTLEGKKVCILGEKGIVLAAAVDDEVHAVAQKEKRGACGDYLCSNDPAAAGDTLAERIKSGVQYMAGEALDKRVNATE